MNFLSLLFAIIAIVLFLLDFFGAWRAQGAYPRPLIALGLAALTASWIAQLVILSHPITS